VAGGLWLVTSRARLGPQVTTNGMWCGFGVQLGWAGQARGVVPDWDSRMIRVKHLATGPCTSEYVGGKQS
jgi:hypothetical protein